ncbi:MAG: DUF5112 domain-containing protein [Prevotellaceae bacterium]|nr:DUF5112 domain-containing protein [Prevotellaceae bacterium]
MSSLKWRGYWATSSKALASALVILSCCLALTACSRGGGADGRQAIDTLNQRAYAFRYRDVDSLTRLSQEALSLAGGYDEFALLNLSYAAYQRMDFQGVDSLLDALTEQSHNQVALLSADVMRMKAAQRINDGIGFYSARRSALKRMARIEEERTDLSERDERLYLWATSEFNIILSTYYFYQENDSLARQAIEEVRRMNLSQKDLAQWIYYNYMVGSGGLTKDSDPRKVTLTEFDHLIIAYSFARRLQYIYFEANALQSLSQLYEHNRDLIEQNRHDDYKMLEALNMSWADDDLALAMIEHSIYLFKTYGDLFQTACAYRTEGELFFGRGENERSIESYGNALHCVNLHHQRYYTAADTLVLLDTLRAQESREVQWLLSPDVQTVPEWIARIRQQLSLAYSAVGDKRASDYNRNAYLDILQYTNQNAELRERNQQLAKEARAVWLRLAAAIVVLLLIFVVSLAYRRKLKRRNTDLTLKLRRLESGDDVPPDLAKLDEESERLEERLLVSRRNLRSNKERNVENRAKVSLVRAVMPYLDRVGGEVKRMRRKGQPTEFGKQYIGELIAEIVRLNDVLTQWIKISKGDLALHITTVSLRRLFGIVSEGRYAFEQRGLRLVIEDTGARVKADEALTLFMINTLADNARKFTPQGETVKLRAEEADGFVEVQVSDTGQGLTEEQAEAINKGDLYGEGHGFGLLNCHSIIEKYRKHSSLFGCCLFGVRSKEGKGSTFFFRLPRVLSLLLLCLTTAFAAAQSAQELYDSVYQCNLEGRYADVLRFGGEALRKIDGQMELFAPTSDNIPREISAYLHGEDMDFSLIMGLRNELALTALALNDWRLYSYNNRIYTQLRKYANQDKTLPLYCERLEAFRHTGRLLLFLIILFSIVALFLIYRLFIGSQIVGEKTLEQRINSFLEELRQKKTAHIAGLRDKLSKSQYEERRIYVQNQILDNCLSAIKHESMYYPSRIRLLAEGLETPKDIERLEEMTNYYRHVYTILCSQADDQLEQPTFKRQGISLHVLFDIIKGSQSRLRKRGVTAEMDLQEIDAAVVGDETLLALFFDNVLRQMAEGAQTLSVRARELGRFVEVTVLNPSASPTEQELGELFSPTTGRVEMLVAKQIIREHDIYSGNPGLRLFAKRQDSGYIIGFTLLKKEGVWTHSE